MVTGPDDGHGALELWSVATSTIELHRAADRDADLKDIGYSVYDRSLDEIEEIQYPRCDITEMSLLVLVRRNFELICIVV